MYALRRVGLGSLGAAQPPPVAGYDWYPVMIKDAFGKSVQAKVCSSPKPFGCQVYQGYAWALVERAGGEFSQPTQLPPPAPPKPPPAPPLPPPPTGVPVQELCHNAFVEWLAAHPREADCLRREDETVWYELCVAMRAGSLSQSQMQQQWQQLVDQRCRAAKPPAPPPQPPVAPPRPPAPPPPYQPPDDDSGGGGGGGSGSGGPDDEAPPADVSVLRSVGPVVGVGLVIAAGLTLYRTRGKGKGRAKRKRRRR